MSNERENKFLQAALDYYDAGYSVIQLEVKGKKPIRAWAEYQRQRAPKELLEQWWEVYPHANVGIVCGRISGIVVVDVDPRNTGDATQIAEVVPSRCIVRTGSGGTHFYTTMLPEQDIPCRPNIKPGVDIKSTGGYVVAPPSIHPCGEPYIWLERGQQCPVPTWCTIAPAPPPTATPSTDTEPWIAEALGCPEGIECGNQEHTLSRLAWYLSDRLPQDITTNLLKWWVLGLTIYDASDPWREDHAIERVGRAYDKRARERRLEIVDDAPGNRVPEDKPGRIALLKSRFQTAKQFSERVKEEVEWIVDGIAGPACLTEIVGPVKLGKTTVTYTMVKAILEGSPFLGRPTRKSNVLVLTEQMGQSLDSSLNRAGILKSDGLFFATSGDMMGIPWPESIEAAVEVAVENDCKIMIIDTFAKLARLEGDNENSAGHIMEALHPFHLAQRNGIACFFVRHARKSGGGIGEAGRGSVAATGVMDICLNLTGKGPYRTIDLVSRLSDVGKPIAIKYSNGLYILQSDKDLQMSALDWELIDKLPDDWRTTAEISEVYGKSTKVTLAALQKIMAIEQSDSPLGFLESRREGKGYQFRKAAKALEIDDAN